MSTLVWIKTHSAPAYYTLVDSEPIKADKHGHVWEHDHLDPEAVRCALCVRGQWRPEAKEQCPRAGRLTVLNACRSRFIEARAAEARRDAAGGDW